MQRVQEREVTFEVDQGWAVPDLSGLGYAFQTAIEELEATYHDTEDGQLRRLGVTVRRRVGGADPGWVLMAGDGVARTEIRSQARRETVPDSLARRLAGVLAGRELRPVAVISTTRRTSRLVDSAGALAVQVADDSISGASLGESSTLDRWREIEVELGPAGTERHLTKITRLFAEAGILPSSSQLKLDRLLGGPLSPADLGEPDEVGRLVSAYVVDQCAAILRGDILLRDQAAVEVVHRTRVAIRRLRSVLRTLPELFAGADEDLDATRTTLDGDLRWLAGVLGDIRDGDVVARRVLDELEQLPPEDVLGPVAREIRETAAADRRTATQRWHASWTDAPYARIMITLATWHTRPPIATGASVKPKRVLKKARRRVERRLVDAHGDPNALHGARKAAKRLRYTAELFTDLVPKAAATADRAKQIQTRLGDHQDLVVAAAFLRRLGAHYGSAEGHNGFTYGVLLARVEHQAAQLRVAAAPDH